MSKGLSFSLRKPKTKTKFNNWKLQATKSTTSSIVPHATKCTGEQCGSNRNVCMYVCVCVCIFLFSIEFAQTVEKRTNWMELLDKIAYFVIFFSLNKSEVLAPKRVGAQFQGWVSSSHLTTAATVVIKVVWYIYIYIRVSVRRKKEKLIQISGGYAETPTQRWWWTVQAPMIAQWMLLLKLCNASR